jgi:hypothetical protein
LYLFSNDFSTRLKWTFLMTLNITLKLCITL